MTTPDPDPASRARGAHPRSAGADPTHPRAAAALLMTGVILAILVLAVISTLNHG